MIRSRKALDGSLRRVVVVVKVESSGLVMVETQLRGRSAFLLDGFVSPRLRDVIRE